MPASRRQALSTRTKPAAGPQSPAKLAEEPMYVTTLPPSSASKAPLKLKGILRNGPKAPPRQEVSSAAKGSGGSLRSSKDFSLRIDQDADVLTEEGNVLVDKSSISREKSFASSAGRGKFSASSVPPRPLKQPSASPSSLKSSSPSQQRSPSPPSPTPRRSHSPHRRQPTEPHREKLLSHGQDFQLSEEVYAKAAYAAKIESLAGIAHVFVIVASLVTVSMMAKVSSVWELHIRRCPMYVETSKNMGVYWGNEKMTACHYAAYMPVLLLVMSLSMIMFHGGVLYSWRHGNQIHRLLLSRTFSKVLFFIEFLEMVIAVSVAGVIIDGVRQTCLSFQLNPWPEERPDNCKEGYQDRDHVYGISGTYSRLMTSMVASMISACMLIFTSILYLIRINPCCHH